MNDYWSTIMGTSITLAALWIVYLLRLVERVKRDNDRLRSLNDALCNRVEAQAGLLTQRAGKEIVLR